MPLTPPEALPAQQFTEIRTHRTPQGFSTRFSGEKPVAWGAAGGFVYARDLKTGWITTAATYSVRGELTVQRLTEYGEHDFNVGMMSGPFTMLFRYGGAKEMPVAQVLEAGWGRTPPVVDGETVEFPQLEGVEVPIIDCPFCFRSLPSEHGKRSHITVMHADRVAADDLATGVTKGMTAAMNQNRQVEELVMPSIEPVEVVEPGPEIWRCTKEGCGRFFDSADGRKIHETKPHDLVMAE